MDYKKLGLGLGVFSVALGALEVAAPGRLARLLGLDENGPMKKIIFGYGLRELGAGALLLKSPAVSTNVWNRVFGDGIDIVTLLLALPASDKKRVVAGALAFVGGATALDVYTATGLDRQTGQTMPLTYGQSDMAPA